MAEPRVRERMEHIYRNVPLGDIPWNFEQPPSLLVNAVNSGGIKPCKTADLGCGAGNYSVWLAGQGFDVTGFDISKEAVRYARLLASSRKVDCRFVVADLRGDLDRYRENFDFVMDWEVLHHVFPKDRPRYVQNVHDLLRPEGTYLSLCFSEDDEAFGGKGKVRETPLKTLLYFSNEDELRQLFAPMFEIVSLSTEEIPGKHGTHRVCVTKLARSDTSSS